MGQLIVERVSPGEVPLFRSTSRAYFSGTLHKGGRRTSDDLLGFGVGELVVMLAPVVLQFSEQVWRACAEQAAQSATGVVTNVFQRLRRRFAGEKHPLPDPAPTLSQEELRYVRDVGRRCAANLPLTEEQKALLVDALIGGLALPEVPEGAAT
jgi:hypothetical protein